MAFGLRPTIIRERRRLGFVVLTAFLAGFLFYLRSGLDIHGIPAPFVIGAIYAFVVGLCALLVCLVVPSMRFMVEAVGISRLGLALFVLANPATGYQILANPALTAAIVVTGGVLVSRLMHGRILRDRRGWRQTVVPGQFFRRAPVRIQANAWQHRYVAWIDDDAPIAA